MPLPVWPAALPQPPLRDGYSPTEEDAVIRTEMESGPGVERLRNLDRWSMTDVKYPLTTAQVVIFKAFWLTSLIRGASPMLLPVWGFDGATLVTRTVKVLSPPTYSPMRKNLCLVSMKIKIRDL